MDFTQKNGADSLWYRIDSEDVFVHLSEGWQTFAEENLGTESCYVDQVLGSRLWSHIRGRETRELYRILLAKVRETGRTISLPYRCDSPSLLRAYEMRIEPAADGIIDFRNRVLAIEQRDPVGLLENDTPRSDAELSVCSICRKIAVSCDEWLEVEEAVVRLRLFDAVRLPRLSNGLCAACALCLRDCP